MDVSPDVLNAPLGLVTDADIGPDGTLYLLDILGLCVHRITPEGMALPALSGVEGGASELQIPSLMSVASDGTCFVTQAYSPMIARYLPDSRPTYPLKILGLDPDWLRGMHMRFEVPDVGNMFWYAHHREWDDGGAPRGPVEATLLRIQDGFTSPLIRTGEIDHDPTSVEVPHHLLRMTINGWDVNAAGEFAWADPDGRYGFTIGYPGSEDALTIQLPDRPQDLETLKDWAESSGEDPGQPGFPRIDALHWLDQNRILVRPTTEYRRDEVNSAGVFELVERNGVSLGRFNVRFPYDPEQDKFFLRDGHLVVIVKGKTLEKWRYNQMPDGDQDQDLKPPELSDLRIRCYSLTSMGRAGRFR